MDDAKMIDHTLLRPDATRDDIEKLAEEAKQYGIASRLEAGAARIGTSPGVQIIEGGSSSAAC